MNLKLILSGILLISLLVACADRNDEETTTLIKMDVKRAKSPKIVSDTLKNPETPNQPNSKDGAQTNDTIDPTKPDRPK